MSAAANGSCGDFIELSAPGNEAGSFTLSGETRPICACAAIFQPPGGSRRHTLMYRAELAGVAAFP